MMKLTETQSQILAVAAAHAHGLALPPERLPAAPRRMVARALLKAGLVKAVIEPGADACARWSMDGEAVLLAITDAGLGAIGQTPKADGLAEAEVEAEQELAQRALDAGIDLTAPDALAQAVAAGLVPSEEPGEGPDKTADATQAGKHPEAASKLQVRKTAALAPVEAEPAPRAPMTLGSAAVAFLAAWDAYQDRAGLEKVVASLRTALAGKQRGSATPRKPREGTKQQQVLDLLRRPEGATVAQVAEATGWQQHTVRGFFAGLKKRQGIAVTVQERVRQVGPGKDGAKGSYSVYRIADAG